MIHRRSLLTWGLSGVLTGCIGPTPPLKVAYLPWAGYAPLQLVRSLGWLGQDQWQALDVKSGTQAVAALQDGLVHAAAFTLDDLLRVRAQGLAVQAVALLDVSVGADVLLGRADIPNLGALKGRRLGLETGAVGQLMAVHALASVGLRLQDVELVPTPYNLHEEVWEQGLVDALVTFEPVAGRLERKAAARLYDSRQLPKDLQIADVLVVREDALPAQDDHLRLLLEAVFRAQRHLHSMSNDSRYRLSAWMGLPPAQVNNAFRGVRLCNWTENRQQLFGEPSALALSADHLASFMQAQQLLPKNIHLNNLVNSRYLPLELLP